MDRNLSILGGLLGLPHDAVDGKLIEIQPEFIYPILAEIIFQSVHFIVRVVHLAQPTLKLLGSTPVFNKFLINIIL